MPTYIISHSISKLLQILILTFFFNQIFDFDREYLPFDTLIRVKP